MYKVLVPGVIAAASLIATNLSAPSFIAQAAQITASSSSEILTTPQPVHTTSRFESKLVTTTETLDRPTITKDDPTRELDDDQVVDEGADGTKTTLTKVYYYEGQKYSSEIVSVNIVDPKPKIISHGTMIVWRTLDTPDGSIRYWRKLHVWATQYDSHCPGCNDWTATGMRQGKGVIAVDPSLIKLGTKAYIPGYGPAIAGDTGGAVNGKIIDLGFDDTKTSGWYSHYVDIYLE